MYGVGVSTIYRYFPAKT
ncbi:hypothetical protein ACISK3_02925 [Morganella morganii]